MIAATNHLRMRPVSLLVVAGAAMQTLAGCSLVPGPYRPPVAPPSGGAGGSGGGGQGAPGEPGPQPTEAGGLVFVPMAIRGQVQRALGGSIEADLLPAGFTLKGRVESSSPDRPFAVEGELRVLRASDENGRELPVDQPPPTSTSLVNHSPRGPRWVVPGSQGAHATASWSCYGIAHLPRRLARVSGVASGYVVSSMEQRDVGLAQGRGPAQLIPGLSMTIQSVRRDGTGLTVQTLLEKSAGFSGSTIEAPRIIRATVLDQRGATMGDMAVLAASLIPPTAGARAYPLTLSMFAASSGGQPTTLRLQIATRIDRVEIPFELRDVALADTK